MIRLQRVGRKHETSFRVVLTDSKNSTKSGKFLEILGSYDPRKTNEEINGERIKYWMSKGAQVSGTLHNLLVTHKIIEGKKINVLPKKKPIVKKEEPKEEVKEETKEASETVEIPKEEAVATEEKVETKEETVVPEEVVENTKKAEEEPKTDEIPVETEKTEA